MAVRTETPLFDAAGTVRGVRIGGAHRDERPRVATAAANDQASGRCVDSAVLPRPFAAAPEPK